MSGIQTLLLQVCVITPVCHWLLSSPRFPRPRNLLLAVGFLIAVAAASEGVEWAARPPSLYRVLDVDRSASPSELKQAFRRQSLLFHPDKNPSPDAAARFAAAQEAYDTLADTESRRLYERYGPSIARDPRSKAMAAQRSEMDSMVGMAGYYLIWGVLTYVMTLGRSSSGQARTWSYTALALSLFAEFQIMFGGWDPLGALLPRTPLFEKVALLHALYPPTLHACRLVGQFLFVDREAQRDALLVAVLESNKEILVSLEQLIQVTQQRGGKAAGAAASGAALKDGAAAVTTGDALRGDEMLPLAARMKRRQEAEQRAALAAQQAAKGKSGGIPSWLIMAGLYALFNYISK